MASALSCPPKREHLATCTEQKKWRQQVVANDESKQQRQALACVPQVMKGLVPDCRVANGRRDLMRQAPVWWIREFPACAKKEKRSTARTKPLFAFNDSVLTMVLYVLAP